MENKELEGISVSISPKIRLKQVLKKAGIEDPATAANLAIAGTVTESDLQYIRENMAENLQELDMVDALFEDNIIPDGTFDSCTCLTSVIIPDSMKKNNNWAFCGCIALTSMTASPNNRFYTSENGVLFNKNKTKLIFYPPRRQGDYIIPDSVKEIGREAFQFCYGLTSVTIPDSVTEIEGMPFYFCNNLISINISDSVKDSTKHLFASENGILFNREKTVLISYPQGRQGEYIIPDSVKEIGACAFHHCYGLTSVFIPNSVTEIGEAAFALCDGLKSVVIPGSVIEIGEEAFFSTGITSVALPASVSKIGKNAFYGCHYVTVHPDKR